LAYASQSESPQHRAITKAQKLRMRLGVEALRQCRGDARPAETGFAGDQHDLAIPRLGARPASQ
jgi:hypothetical protein